MSITKRSAMSSGSFSYMCSPTTLSDTLMYAESQLCASHKQAYDINRRIVPVHEDFADLDALAAGTQGVLHALAAADDGHTAKLLCEVHAHILASRGCQDCLLCEWQMP